MKRSVEARCLRRMGLKIQMTNHDDEDLWIEDGGGDSLHSLLI